MRFAEFHWGLGRVVLAALSLAVSGCTGRAPGIPQMPPPEVTVSKPTIGTVTDYFEFPGQTAAVEEVEVRARVYGHIVKRGFRDGQEVKRGDLLFEIDPRPYQAAQQQAAGDLARLEAALAKAQADLLRGQQLLPSRAISQEDYEQLVMQQASAKASVLSAKGRSATPS